MVHMFSVPAGAAFSACQSQPRMIYITNTELDDSGSVRAIHSHRETAEIALVYQGHGAHKIDNRIYNSEPGDLLLYNTGILHPVQHGRRADVLLPVRYPGPSAGGAFAGRPELQPGQLLD